MPHTLHPEEETRRRTRIIDEMSALRGEARAAESDALAMTQLATELDRRVEDLRPLLHVARSLHTDATWQGTSANRSRDLLDTAAGKAGRLTAIVGRTADNLRSRARVRSTQADSAWTALQGLYNELDAPFEPIHF